MACVWVTSREGMCLCALPVPFPVTHSLAGVFWTLGGVGAPRVSSAVPAVSQPGCCWLRSSASITGSSQPGPAAGAPGGHPQGQQGLCGSTGHPSLPVGVRAGIPEQSLSRCLAARVLPSTRPLEARPARWLFWEAACDAGSSLLPLQGAPSPDTNSFTSLLSCCIQDAAGAWSWDVCVFLVRL